MMPPREVSQGGDRCSCLCATKVRGALVQADEAERAGPAASGPAPVVPGPEGGVDSGPGNDGSVGVNHADGVERASGAAGRAGWAGRLGTGAMGIAQGAALIASLTLLSRILGLARTVVFSQTVGSDCLGTVYVT